MWSENLRQNSIKKHSNNQCQGSIQDFFLAEVDPEIVFGAMQQTFLGLLGRPGSMFPHKILKR